MNATQTQPPCNRCGSGPGEYDETCPPCDLRAIEMGVNPWVMADDHGPGCDGPLNCTCEPAWDGAR